MSTVHSINEDRVYREMKEEFEKKKEEERIRRKIEEENQNKRWEQNERRDKVFMFGFFTAAAAFAIANTVINYRSMRAAENAVQRLKPDTEA